MGIATGLERRGAVYYWRKRLPDGLAERIGLTHVKLSLRTRDPQEARYLGACLNKMAAELLMSELPEITREQLQSLFRKTFEQHRRKLALLADFARSERGFMPSQEIQEETATGWAYQHFSRNGLHASVDEDARDRFAKVGLSEEEIERVTATVDRMKASGEATPSASRLAEAITVTGAEVTAATKAKAQPIYLRALAEALLKTDERYRHILSISMRRSTRLQLKQKAFSKQREASDRHRGRPRSFQKMDRRKGILPLCPPDHR